MYDEKPVKRFAKDLKLMKKQGKDLDKLQDVIDMLRNDIKLPLQYKDHWLTNNWKGCRECHIEPDWLLIYKIDESQNVIWLLRTGTHHELFEDYLQQLQNTINEALS